LSLPHFFKKATQDLKNFFTQFPKKAGEMALHDVAENFRTESFDGVKWAPRKKKDVRTRALLVKTGRLKRSVRIARTSNNSVTVTSNVPYAEIHNQGGSITLNARSELFKRNRNTKGNNKGKFTKGTTAGKGATYKQGSIKIPKRQFMGMSKNLQKQIGQSIDKSFDIIFKQ
jgi:phage gpG-like protein